MYQGTKHLTFPDMGQDEKEKECYLETLSSPKSNAVRFFITTTNNGLMRIRCVTTDLVLRKHLNYSLLVFGPQPVVLRNYYSFSTRRLQFGGPCVW